MSDVDPPQNPAPQDPYPYVQRVPTRWNDNDVFGHLNNTVYYAVMDTTVTTWLLTEAGMPLTGSQSQGQSQGQDQRAMAVVASSGCEFMASAAFPDVLLVGLRAARLGTSSVTWEFAISREGDGLALATGRWVHVFLDPGTGRPTPIPPTLRARIESDLLVAG